MLVSVAEPYTCTQVDEAALQAWERDGVLRIAGLIPPEWFPPLRQRLGELLGAPPESPAAWPYLKPDLFKPLGRDQRYAPVEVAAVKAAVGQLIGRDWDYPRSGGSWFVNAPRQLEKQLASELARVPRGAWHWDDRPDLRVGLGLWLFTPVIDLPPHSGGTWLAAGSARMVTDFFSALPAEKKGTPTKLVRKWFAADQAWFAGLNGDAPLALSAPADAAVRLLNVAGKPGDVVMMKDFTIHSAPEYIGPGPRICQVVVASPSS